MTDIEDLKLKELQEFLKTVDTYKKLLENYTLNELELLDKKLGILKSMQWTVGKPPRVVMPEPPLRMPSMPEPAISKVDRIIGNLINPESIKRLAEALTGVADRLDKKQEKQEDDPDYGSI